MLAAAVVGQTLATLALAVDEAGSADHPLIGRYEGASIVFYKTTNFDEVALLRAPHDYAGLLERQATDDRSGAEWLTLEGARYQDTLRAASRPFVA